MKSEGILFNNDNNTEYYVLIALALRKMNKIKQNWANIAWFFCQKPIFPLVYSIAVHKNLKKRNPHSYGCPVLHHHKFINGSAIFMAKSKLQIDFFIFPDTSVLVNLKTEISSEKFLIDNGGGCDLWVNREVSGGGVEVHPVRGGRRVIRRSGLSWNRREKLVVGMGRRGMKKIAMFGFGSVFAMNVHMATKCLSVSESTLAKCALVRAFCGVIISVVFQMMVLWFIFIARTVPAPLFSKIHAEQTQTQTQNL